MYIAMNRFRIAAGREPDFETMWRNRESYLHRVPGFRQFRLLRGTPADGVTPFVSYSEWDSLAAFEAWTQSEEFRLAHGQARSPQGTVLGPPSFEGYEVVELG